MKPMKIDKWSVIGDNDPYLAPELRTIHLHGYVENHPKLGTTTIRTSPIVKLLGERTVQTHSGSIYKLGKIHPSYRRFLRKIRPNWDYKIQLL